MRRPEFLARQPLRLRLIAATTAVLVATLGLFAWVVLHLLDESLRVQLRERVDQVEPLLAATLAPATRAGDRTALDGLLESINARQHFTYVVVFDRDANIIAQAGWQAQKPLPPEDPLDALPSGPTLDRRLPLSLDGAAVGSVRYGLSLDFLHEARNRLLTEAAIAGVLGTLASIGVLLWLGWAMTRELARINHTARRIAEGDFSVRLREGGRGEVGQLGRSLNMLASALEARLRDLKANEERLALVIQGTADGIWDWDLKSNQRYYSPRFRELLGYADEREFRVAYSDDNALHPDDRAAVLAAQASHLENRTPFDCEYRLRCRDGEYRWFRGRGQASWDADGRAARFAGSITDVDRRHRDEAAQREDAARLAHIVDGGSDGAWDWDLEHQRYFISPALKAQLGYSDDELPDDRASFFQLMPHADRHRVKAEIARHFTEGAPFDTELRLTHKDGSQHWYRARGRAVRDEAGRLLRFAGVCLDNRAQHAAHLKSAEIVAQKQSLIENSLVGIALVREPAIATANRRMGELFGRAPDSLCGQPAAALFADAADYAALTEDATHHARAGTPLAREVELVRADGERFWGIVTTRALDADAPAAGSVWIFLDNSDRRRAVDAIRSERDFANAILNAMPGVFYLVDRSGRLLRWNTNLEQVTGHTRGALAAMRGKDLYALEDHRALREATMLALRHGESAAELTLLARDGSRHAYQITGVRVEIDGQTHLAGIGFDIGARKRREAEIRRDNDELERRVAARTADLDAANRELESFSYSVSHDLSAPLRGIDGFSRMLAEDYAANLPEVAQSYLARIRAATQRMQQLIDDLLRLSRVSRDDLVREPLDLSAMAHEIFDELRAAQPARQVDVIVTPGLRADADANLMRIALNNLLRNAWKFTSRHPHARIEVGCLRAGEQTVYFVKDDGAGFDMRYVGKLFGAFHRLHRSSEFEGTGIGLAIVARILLRHGGRIWAEGHVEQGATFYFTLGE